MPDDQSTILVLTNDLKSCLDEHETKGYRLLNTFVLKFYPKYQDWDNPKTWACQFYRKQKP